MIHIMECDSRPTHKRCRAPTHRSLRTRANDRSRRRLPLPR
jgi:hypothetical protein